MLALVAPTRYIDKGLKSRRDLRPLEIQTNWPRAFASPNPFENDDRVTEIIARLCSRPNTTV